MWIYLKPMGWVRSEAIQIVRATHPKSKRTAVWVDGVAPACGGSFTVDLPEDEVMDLIEESTPEGQLLAEIEREQRRLAGHPDPPYETEEEDEAHAGVTEPPDEE